MSNSEIKITFSEDEYKAYADFIPSLQEGAKLDLLYVKKVLTEAGIDFGIDWETIKSTIAYCNSTGKAMSSVKIATGTLPLSEVPPHWNLEEKFFHHAMGFDVSQLKVDFKEVSNFILVKKGELIARYDNGRSGVEGKSVRSKPIPFKKKKIVQFTNGRNTAEYQNNLYSAISGRYEVTETREIIINDILHIQGDVDYSTGNISFPKDVIIDGQVKDGFKIAVGGSLFCKSNLDATDVLCRQDLIAEQGILGRKEAILKIGGKISAKFIENCHVESKDGINVSKNIMNSTIYTLGKLVLGEKGAIVSSHICTELGVKAYNIGKLGSPNGDIEAGYSFIDKRIIDSLNQRIEVLKEKLGHLTKLPEYRKTEKRKVLIDQIQEAITKAEEELRKKNSNLYKAKDATVLVYGTIYPGNTITICGLKYTVTEEMRKVKFYLNTESYRLEHVPL